MPLESYYGSSGVDVIYPSQMMNPHQYSEPEWNPSPLVNSSTFPNRRTFIPENPLPLHPHDYETPYSTPHIPPPIEVSTVPSHVPFSRPKSSPSTFGPNVEDLLFTENPFRIKHEDYGPQMFSMSPQHMPSTKAPSPFYDTGYPVSNPSHSPGRQQGPVPIAPDPVGLRQMNALKRMREDEEYSEYGQKKRRRAPSQVGPVELNEEEQLLLKLKEEENLPWKDIAIRFQTDLGKSYQVPALQMRFKRLRERMRTWTETDVQALEQAYDYWEKFQFDIIAAKEDGANLFRAWIDGGLRGIRTMACQVLRPKMGGDTPRARAIPNTIKPPPGSMGHHQSGGIASESQPQPASDAMKSYG